MVCHGIKLVFSHHTHKPLGSSVYGKCCIASVCIFSGRIIAQPHDSCALSETGSVPADWQNCYVTTGVEAIPKIIALCDAVDHETCFFCGVPCELWWRLNWCDSVRFSCGIWRLPDTIQFQDALVRRWRWGLTWNFPFLLSCVGDWIFSGTTQ